MKITSRPVNESDAPLLLGLYASTRAAEMAMVPWSDEQKAAFVQMQFIAQTTHYRGQFPEARHDVICCDGDPVGRIYLDRSADRLHILDITIAPERRNKGIGAAVLKEMLEEADQAQKRTTIYTEKDSPSVRFFERLGFRVVEFKDYQVLLERPPASFQA